MVSRVDVRDGSAVEGACKVHQPKWSRIIINCMTYQARGRVSIVWQSFCGMRVSVCCEWCNGVDDIVEEEVGEHDVSVL